MAREPDPDLEFDDLGDDVQETRPSGLDRPRPKRRSSRKPIHWLLFFLIVAIGGLFAYDPEMAMELFGLSTPQAPPPMTMSPPPKATPPSPTSTPRPSTPTPAPAPVAPQSAAPTAPSSLAAPRTMTASITPLFSEGQRVMVIADPALPSDNVTLSPDPSGTKSGPAVRAGATLIVMDGELRDGGWVYSVRTPEGLSGWLPEKRLAPQR